MSRESTILARQLDPFEKAVGIFRDEFKKATMSGQQCRSRRLPTPFDR